MLDDFLDQGSNFLFMRNPHRAVVVEGRSAQSPPSGSSEKPARFLSPANARTWSRGFSTTSTAAPRCR